MATISSEPGKAPACFFEHYDRQEGLKNFPVPHIFSLPNPDSYAALPT